MPLDLPYTVFGRPLKPLALAATVTMIVIVVINMLDIGIARSAAWGDAVAGAAAAAGVALAIGWWRRSQGWAEAGLLLASGVWTARCVFGVVTDPDGYGWAMSGAWVIALGGAYLLERVESLGRRYTRRVAA